MLLDKKTVHHIARLARIELSADEEEKFEKELSGILAFVEELNVVDTSGTAPLTGGTLLENAMREDADTLCGGKDKPDTLLNAAPEKKDRYVKVKAVFE